VLHLFSSSLPTGVLQPTPSTPLLLMANVTELAATGNTDADHAEADRIAAAAAVDAHSTAIAEVDHQVVEADHLAAEATQASMMRAHLAHIARVASSSCSK
jgi:hypothetical protein